MKKNSDHLTLGATNQKSHEHVLCFCSSTDFLILTLDTLRLTTHIIFDLPTQVQDIQWPIEKIHNASISNRKLQKFSKGAFW